MKIFTCTKFTGHYPVGAAAVVAARDAETAAEALNQKLRADHHLAGDAEAKDMIEMAIPVHDWMQDVRVLVDGDY